jgi:hypothetical protein
LRVSLLKIDKSDILDLFSFLLKHSNSRVRIGSAKLALYLAESQTLDILIECLHQEIDQPVRRVYVQSIYHLGKHLPKELAQFLIENDDDWLVQSYALLSLDKRKACLLISDGTHFATELGTIAEEAGFKIITLSQSLPLLEMEKAEDEILKAYELVLLVRGEHYSQGMFSGFYKKIKQFVSEGGNLFAASWTSWETRNLWTFVDVLPFTHVGSGFKEDLAITCNITESELAQKVHFTRTTYRASFEILRTKENSTTLLQADDGTPLFGYHQYGSGFCYYLNTCQHSCFSNMQSPLQTSADLYCFLENIFEWIYTIRGFH